MKKTFGRRLRKIRKAKNLMAKEVAAAVDLSQSALSQIETGNVGPSIETMVAVADFLDVSLDYLTGRTDNEEIT